MASIERPRTRYQPSDWVTASTSISFNAERQRDASHDLRQETRAMRSEVENEAQYDQYNNTNRLSERVELIKNYFDSLQREKDRIEAELSFLDYAKGSISDQIKNIQTPKECVNECLALRDRRRNIDLVEDLAEIELKNENELLNRQVNILQNKITEVFNQMRLLKQVQHQLLLDSENKHDALNIDLEQSLLSTNCPGISFKPNSTRIPQGTVNPVQWQQFSDYNLQHARSAIDASIRLREGIYMALTESDNEIEAQAQATERALRQRRNEMQRALDELNHQKTLTEAEIEEMKNDLDGLERTIHNMIPPGKLAQTRLENRTYRPGMELCRDMAQVGLTDEVRQIEVTIEALLERQRQCRHALNALQNQLNRINADIELKQNSLANEEKCIELRQRRMDRRQPDVEINASNTEPSPISDVMVVSPPTSVPDDLASRLLS